MTHDDAEVVVVLGALLHCVGMAVHREGHEDFSLFLAEPKMRELLDGVYDEPDRTVIVSEVLQAITSHRDDGKPLTIEAGILRVADALDMAKGRSRIPFERGSVSIHSLSAAAIDEVTIKDGEQTADHDRDPDEQLVGHLPGRRASEGEAARLGPRAVRRGRSRTSTPRPRSVSCRSTGSSLPRKPRISARIDPATESVPPSSRGCYDPARALRDSLMVGRRILAPEVGVRVPVPQHESPRYGGFCAFSG